ncbi:MAG: hypothetical protein JWP19_1513 [Rhodoglobus sp.]|nr:hypothetical protein [Rhodoglobus sp.]
MRLTLVAIVAASVAVLAGCAPDSHPPAGLTQSQVDAIIAADNDARWSFFFEDRPDVARPQVDRLGYVAPRDAEAFYKKCLTTAGVNPDYIYGFGAYDQDPAGQTATYLAYYTCVAQYPVNPISVGFLSQAQLGFVYDYFVGRLAPCLRSLGYQVAAPPSKRAFVGGSVNGSTWDPYAGVHPTPGPHSWAFIDERCPPLPAETYGTRHP